MLPLSALYAVILCSAKHLCDVTYVNNTGKNTYGEDAAKVSKVEINGETVATEGKIVGEMAEAVRDGKVSAITVYFC